MIILDFMVKSHGKSNTVKNVPYVIQESTNMDFVLVVLAENDHPTFK